MPTTERNYNRLSTHINLLPHKKTPKKLATTSATPQLDNSNNNNNNNNSNRKKRNPQLSYSTSRHSLQLYAAS